MAPAQDESSESEEKVAAVVESAKETEEERAPPPTWLDAGFIQKALKQESDVYGGDEEQVEDVEIQHATAVGDNYCSCIFRARTRLRGSSVPRSLLVKCLPEGETFRQLVVDTLMFEKESHMFTEVVPAMEALLETAAPRRYPPFTARCLLHGSEPSRFLVLQDLGPEGFRLADRHKGMDLPHALVAIKALGRFHGASSVLWRRRPEMFETLDNPFEKAFGREEDAENFLNIAAETIASWEDFPGDYDKKVLALKGKIFLKNKEIHRTRLGKFNVLVHGDFWLNNMLFGYEGEDVHDVRFVDLQFCHVTNPVFDLMLLRYTSLQEEVVFEHWDILLEEYVASMAETLHALGEEAPTLEDIQSDMHEGRHFAVFAGLLWLPIVRLNSSDGKYDAEQAIAEGVDSQSAVYKTAVFKHWMEMLLPIFDSSGVFDL